MSTDDAVATLNTLPHNVNMKHLLPFLDLIMMDILNPLSVKHKYLGHSYEGGTTDFKN